MLKVDFNKILPPPPLANTMSRPTRVGRMSKPVRGIGDLDRLRSLPDAISTEFVASYNDLLEDLLHPYVVSGVMTLSHAGRYRQALIETIFGSENHLGIFHYLKDRDKDSKLDKELVAYAEQLILKGWQIRREEDGRYWINNGDLQRIVDVTGRAPLHDDIAAASFDESSAHIFLRDDVASKVSALSRTLGHDADSLAATGNLDILLSRIADNKFAGYIINYNALRRILSKPTTYQITGRGMSALDLHDQGYRLGSRIMSPSSEKAVLEWRGEQYAVSPVKSSFNGKHMVNRYSLMALGAKVKSDLLGGETKIFSPEIAEISDFSRVFALMCRLPPAEFAEHSFTDTLDTLDNLFSSTRPSSFIARLSSAIASVIVIDGLLLGNRSLSLSAIAVDSVTGKVFSSHSLDYFSLSDLGISRSEKSSLGKEVFLNNYILSTPEIFSAAIKLIPRDMIEKIASYTLDTSNYPQELLGVREHFERAREIIVGSA